MGVGVTREEYGAARVAFHGSALVRDGRARVTERDYVTEGRAPYRFLHMELACAVDDAASTALEALGVALLSGATTTISLAVPGRVQVELAVARDLDPEEIARACARVPDGTRPIERPASRFVSCEVPT